MSFISLSSGYWSTTARWGVLLIAGWALFMLSAPRPVLAQNGTIPAAVPAYELSATLSNDDDTAAIAAGDLNGDGALDLVMGNRGDPNMYYLNDGHGNFDAGTPFGLGTETYAIALADMDDDGDLDIITSGAQNVLYFNDGNAHFANQNTFGDSPIYQFVLGDIDGDRDFDLVAQGAVEGDSDVGTLTGEQQIWRNDGRGHLTATANVPGLAAHLIDFDSDGDLDLVMNAAGDPNNPAPNGALVFYTNDGTGSFTTRNNLTISPPYGNQTVAAFGDLDGDGRLDLVLSSTPTYFGDYGKPEGLTLYRNLGPGNDLPVYTPQSINEVGGAGFIQLDDIDLDGDLDIVASGLRGHLGLADDLQGYLYLNQGLDQDGALQFTRVPWGPSTGDSGLGILADLDGDGIDEIVVGNTHFDTIYANPSRPDFGTCVAPTAVTVLSLRTLIDLAGDGDLDMLYTDSFADSPTLLAAINDGTGHFQYDTPIGATIANTFADVTTADLNADGLDDLIALHYDQAAQIYLQAHAGIFSLHTTLDAASTAATAPVITGDLDGDGALDLVLSSGQSQIYFNQGNGSFGPALPFGAASEENTSLVLADLDNDGNLDIVVRSGHYYTAYQNFIYWNRGNWATSGAEHFVVTPLSTTPGFSQQVVVGDFNGDGFADLVVVDARKSESIFLNAGDRTFTQQWLTPSDEQVNGLFALDLDLDRDLDLLTGYSGSVLRNDGHGSFAWHQAFLDLQQPNLGRLAGMQPRFVSDLNGDGLTDVIADRIYSGEDEFESPCLAVQTRHAARPQPARPVRIKLLPLANTVLDGPYASPQIFAAGTITFTYTLFDPTARPADVRGFYSLDGGGQWLPALPTAATTRTELATLANNGPITHTYTWDVLGSGFFGQSDRVVFRLEAYPNLRPQPNGVPGPYRLPYQTAQSYPFRVRGTQVRIVDPAGAPMPDALLYRLPANASGAAMPFAATQGAAPFRTNSQGYLSGRATLNTGDQLVALAPITATQSYTLYHMSATPTLNGLAVHNVTKGVQTLTVAAAHPLLLFNLTVALEWDARKDTLFLDQLEFDLRRTAEFLFDATDGQAALGAITLYHNKEHWDDADIRIYASNALIPNADPGGIVRSEQSETIASNPFINATTPYSLTYQPGHIRIGAVWNRFGEASGALGEDWPRTLAHELGHYAFYLYDNYLGLQDGVVVPVATCTGTLMTDQYREDFSEFRPADTWATDCAQTISAQRSGRSDWATVTRFYPWLKAPSAATLNNGPATLPLAVTQVQRAFSPSEPMPLEVASFDLLDANGKAQPAGEHAQAVLYSQGRLIDLGHPVGDKLTARGAHVGDRLCVYDLPSQHLGCETVTNNDSFLTLVEKTSWAPTLTVSPASSTTVGVLVSGVGTGLNLRGKLYPENGIATADLPLIATVDGGYAATFVLATGALAGHIQVWLDEADSPSNPRRESLTSYALGGSPGKRKTSCSPRCISAAGVGVAVSDQVAPAIAPDGQVLIYGNVRFDDGEFYALQKVNGLPTPPLWTTVVGDGYRILKSDAAPDLVNTSILFRYRGQDVPAGEEKFLSLYFWQAANSQWQRLPTVLNPAVNEASAQALGPGLYVLMSSLEIPLRQTGWNLIAYPVQETRPVTQALASLANSYSTVYSYVATDAADPWKVYAPAAPIWVNDLKVLEFGQGYWINATQPMTWLVKGPEDDQVQAAINSLPMPPATFYGAVLAGNGLTPAAGLPMHGLINGAVCGAGVTQAMDGQIVYSLNVAGDGVRNPACIGVGQQVFMTVAGIVQAVVPWQNDRVQPVVINGSKLYLPVIRHGQ